MRHRPKKTAQPEQAAPSRGGLRQSTVQTKLAWSSMLPEPVYLAYAGNGQSGRVRPGQGVAAGAVPMILAGGAPFSTQFTTAVNASMVLVEGPPPRPV